MTERLLAGKKALIVGVGDGVGRATATAFAREGADLLLVARTAQKTEAIRRQLGSESVNVKTVIGDIGDVDSCARVAEAAASLWGRVDVLVMVPTGSGGTTFEGEDAALSGWRQNYDITVFGTMQMTKATVPLMLSTGDARVIYVNSMAAERSVSGIIGYSSSKAALQSIARSLAVELGPYGIRVNGVHPGTIEDEGIWNYFRQVAERDGITPEQVYESVISTTVLGLLPHSEDVAATILYLASPMARAVTGQAIHVNGGQWPTVDHPPSRQPGLRAREYRNQLEHRSTSLEPT
jgi:NAD(P)-dependent dehydrogenase (short-subunit alcohol dehydrogenase family)